MDDFGTRVRAALAEQGISLRGAARALNYDVAYLSRVLNGKQSPSPQPAEGLDGLLGAGGEVVRLLGRPETAGEVKCSGTGSGFADSIRTMSRHLVSLDNEMNGLPIADMAARAFKAVHRRLGTGDYEPDHERDIRAAAAELAEVAGWALFDAERQSAARRFNQEALFLARLSEDREIELLVLQNMAMQSGWLRRPGEELAIARSVLERGRRISPRIEAVFRLREAKGLAGSGQIAEAASRFDQARSLLGDGQRTGDPFWTWWITTDEIDGNQGFALQEACEWKKAVPYLQRALRQEAGAKVGYRNISAVRLLACLLEEHAWRDAEELAVSLMPTVAETSSVRTLRLLDRTVRAGEGVKGVPANLRDALDHIRDLISEDPYTI